MDSRIGIIGRLLPAGASGWIGHLLFSLLSEFLTEAIATTGIAGGIGGLCLADRGPRAILPQSMREEMPRILVTGASGEIGTSLRKLLPPIYPDLC